MALKIQRIPAALLNFLGVTGGTGFPNELPPITQPTVELTPFYLARILQTFTQTDTPIQNAGDSSVVLVPNTETWILSAIGLAISPGVPAAAILEFSAFVRYGNQPNSVPIFNFTTTIASVNDRVDRGLQLSSPLVLPPGSSITWLLERPLGAAIGITSRHMVARLTGA